MAERRNGERISLRLVLAIIAGIVIPLEAATFFYVIQTEHRLTRLEGKARLSLASCVDVPQPAEYPD